MRPYVLLWVCNKMCEVRAYVRKSCVGVFEDGGKILRGDGDGGTGRIYVSYAKSTAEDQSYSGTVQGRPRADPVGDSQVVQAGWSEPSCRCGWLEVAVAV